jgi:hypothetical protein
VPDGGVSSGISVGANTHTTYIGKKYTSTFYLNGKLSQVCFFDYALSESQVTTLWGGGTEVSNPMALPSPPIAYYPLGESAGAFQTPVNNNDKWLIENNAIGDYVFDFSSDYIETNGVGDVLGNACTNFTTAFWFNHDQTPSTSGLYEFDVSPTTAGTGKHGIRLLSDTRFEIIYRGTLNGAAHFGQSRYNMPSGLNTWMHLVVSFDGTNNTAIYVNGQPATLYQQYTATPDSVDFAETSVDIGIYNTNNSIYRYDGKISNFQVFNSSLTATEATTLYNYGSPIRTLANIPQNSNLKAWYKLDASEIYNSSITDWEINNAVSSYNNSLFVDNLLQPSTSTNGITMGSYNDTAGLSAVSWSLWVNLKTLNSASGYSTMINGNSFSFSTNGGS